ncbi:MAG: ABC transporter ATP-binding protein [Planctomycetes bacterium]|nr:ABC transporter ATP-binding protein [Planctomycetota bacterium]
MFLETQSLCKFYRAGTRDEVRALDDISVGVERGEVLVVVGPSGSGKTTLLALLGALERPTRGHIFFEGRDLGECSDVALARVRRRMGFIFQDFSLIPDLSAGENITYPLIPRGVPRAERWRRAEELLSRFGLGGKLTARARELSGGEQQRVAVARALAGEPEVVLADEPTSNLDPVTGQGLLDLLRELNAGGTTLILSSHDPAVISLAGRVCELEGGKLRARPNQ